MRNNLYICNAKPQTKTTLTSHISGSNFGTHYKGDISTVELNVKGGYSNGKHYEGKIVNGEFSEEYFMYYPDGRKYKGQWKNDKWEGRGTLYWPNGDRYEGEVSQDNLNGFGVYYRADGMSRRCEYRDGNFVRWLD